MNGTKSPAELDRPETYPEQLAKFKYVQAARETAEAEARKTPPRNLDNGQIYKQCPRCNSAMWPGPGLCLACECERTEKWKVNITEERRIMADAC